MDQARGGSMNLMAAGVSKAPTGAAVERPERPMTANRVAGAVPMTAAGRPIGTANKNTLQAPGTAFKRVGAAGGAIGRVAPQVEARPLTQQGMGGLKPATQAAGRQVLDRSYFLSALRQKRQEVLNVTHEMRDELETLAIKAAAYARAEKRQEELQKEVRALQEGLADTNMVIDKAGVHAPLPSIQAEYIEVANRNKAQRLRVEELITDRLSLEQAAKQADTQVTQLQASLDAQLSSLGPSARQQYVDLLSEQAALLAERQRYEEDLGELDRQLATAEGEMARNPFKQRALDLQEQVCVLSERKLQLVEEEDRGKASPEEQRDQLMSRIKRENAEVERLTAAAKALGDEVRRLEDKVTAAAGRAAGTTAHDPQRREKFEELKAKERELAAFMDDFPHRRAAKLSELAAAHDAIVGAMERLTKLKSLAGGAMPSKGQFQDMQDELTYKKQQLESAAATGEALKSELAARRGELAQVEGLGEKIGGELAAVQARMKEMKGEVEGWSHMEEGQERAKAAVKELGEKKDELLAQREAVKSEVSERTWQQEAKQAQLSSHPAWPVLQALEEKVAAVQGNVYSTQEYVTARQAESNYTPLVDQVKALVGQLNEAHIAVTRAAMGFT